MIQWPNRLVEQIARRRAIPYIGAGFSRASQNDKGERPPLWDEFLISAKNQLKGGAQLVASLIKDGRYLDACSILSQKLGQDWIELVAKAFNSGYKASLNHEYLYDLDCPIVITPNFDKIYDTYATTQSEGTVTVKSYDANDLVRHVKGDAESRLVLKCHGTVDAPDALVFSREKYAQLVHRHPAYNGVMNSLFLTNTVFFLGTSGSDPDISLVLERHVQLYENNAPHYFITGDKKTQKLSELFRKSYNLEVIGYRPDDNHNELSESLKELRELVNVRRGELAATLSW